MSGDPYQSPSIEAEPTSSELGSLSQSARTTQLNSARNILLFIGIITTLVNAFFLISVRQNVRAAIEAEQVRLRQQGQQLIIDEDSAVNIAMAIQGVAVGLGVVFIVMGLTVKMFPVPITVGALILYIAANAIFGMLDPASLLMGLIMKVIIVVCLISAIKTAFAYEQERRASEAQAFNAG